MKRIIYTNTENLLYSQVNLIIHKSNQKAVDSALEETELSDEELVGISQCDRNFLPIISGDGWVYTIV